MDVLMPQMGETVSEGTVSAWHRKVGDTVKVGDVLFEIETDKASLEVEAMEAGTISAIHVQEGQTVPVGAVVAVIGDGVAGAAPAPASASAPPPPAPASREAAEAAQPAPSGGGTDILMPQLGETVTEGTISVWHRKVGDAVKVGDPLFEIETDKTSMEIEATAAGTLTDILVREGQTVPVETVVAVLNGSGTRQPGDQFGTQTQPARMTEDDVVREAYGTPAPQPTTTPGAATATPAPAPSAPASGQRSFAYADMDPFMEVRTPADNYGPAKGPDGIRITPVARRLIAERGLDVAALAAEARARGATRIARADVPAAAPAAPAARAPAQAPAPSSLPAIVPGPGDTVVELNRIRRITAERLAESWRTAPHVFQTVEVDFSRISEVRNAHKDAFKARHGASLTFLPFILRATAIALGEFPDVNALYQDGRLIRKRDINIGIAIDLNHEGLVVPVLAGADGYNVPGLAREIDRMVAKARDGKLTPGDFEGGSYTISNNGSFGTLFTAPIINIPQTAIMSTDAIRKRPVAVTTPDGEALAIRPVGVVGQSFDHRAYDGAYSARFLSRVKEILEGREWASEF